MIEGGEESGEGGRGWRRGAVERVGGGERLGCSAEQDSGGVGISCTGPDAVMATQILQANPDISLDDFHQMPKMYTAVGIGQRAGYQDFSLFHVVILLLQRPYAIIQSCPRFESCVETDQNFPSNSLSLEVLPGLPEHCR